MLWSSLCWSDARTLYPANRWAGPLLLFLCLNAIVLEATTPPGLAAEPAPPASAPRAAAAPAAAPPAGPPAAPPGTPRPLRALLICGGCCHDYDSQKTLLARGLAERAYVDVTVVHQGGQSTKAKIPYYEQANWAEGYDVVLHDECFADVTDRDWVARILAPHRAGLPAVVIHCAMHCYRDGSDDWFKFLGVTSRTHGKHYPHEVLNVDADHPIMETFGPAWFNPAGELYWIEKLWPTARPLAVAKNRENGRSETCVWTNQYGTARVFGTTLGHHNETVASPEFLDLVTRGTLWACGKLEPAYLRPVTPRRVPVNLARGKPAQASTEESGKGNVARLACDGNPATRWCAADGSVNQWIEVDLGKVQSVTGARLEWEGRDAAYRFRLEGSVDGQKWTLLADGSQNQQAGPNEVQCAAQVRQLRVTYLGCDRNLWGSLWEFQVYGEETTVEEPLARSRSKEQELLAEVKVPPEFTATLFAAPPAVTYPVFVAAAPEGTVYVSSDGNGSLGRDPHRGRVLRLRDRDGDGRADEVKLFVPDVDSPRGLVWDHDRLYLLHPPHLSAFLDRDGDGVAEEQQILVKNVAFDLTQRPADHTSNGVTLGVDGWLYLAIGDFGFMNAEGTDGRKLRLRGGGVVRVRTDGSGLEVVSRGTRNILEVSVDPRLNGFARDNTNDGGGWDIRLHHFSGLDDHGYPSLFRNFPEDARTPLDIYGGGSGCGGLYLDEPGFPPGYGDALYTADWGRQWVYRHPLQARGASFTAEQHEFVSVTRVTDLDVDASSRMYVASWRGATFNYAGEEVGYLVRVTPRDYRAEPVPDFARLSPEQLVEQLAQPSHRRRLAAQRVLLRREWSDALTARLVALARDPQRSLPVRVAALCTLKQARGTAAHPQLVALAADPALRSYALRCLTDRLDERSGVPGELLVAAASDPDPRVRRQAAESVARLGQPALASAIVPLLVDTDPLVAHTTLLALATLPGDEACLQTLTNSQLPLPVRAAAARPLGRIHEPRVVEALARRLETESEPVLRQGIVTALCRLFHGEGEWQGDSWGTRPDTAGPYYQAADWSGTPAVAAALRRAVLELPAAETQYLVREVLRHRIPYGDLREPLLERATRQAELVPAVVELLAADPRPPATAAGLLIPVVQRPDSAARLRSQAIIALSRLSDTAAWAALLQGLVRLDGEQDAAREREEARQAVLGSAQLAEQVELLSETARGGDLSLARWADAALIAVLSGPRASAAARISAQRALEQGQEQPARRRRLLEAARMAREPGFKAQVLAALQDRDPEVAALASQVAGELKYRVQSKVKPAGPTLAQIPPQEAVTAVLAQTGDPALGEELFGRLGCAKCHTVRASEPPRGPFLGTIANTYKRRELAESILFPSKSLAQGFVTQVFALEDGRTVTGFVVQEGADRVVVRDAEAREFIFRPADIEQRVKQTISLMPEGLVRDITIPELASLLDYLEALPKSKP